MLAYYYQAISCYHSSLFSTHIFSITSYCLPWHTSNWLPQLDFIHLSLKWKPSFHIFLWVDRSSLCASLLQSARFFIFATMKNLSFSLIIRKYFLWIIQISSSLESNCWCYFKCLAVNIKSADLSENVGKIFLLPKPVSPVEFQVSVLKTGMPFENWTFQKVNHSLSLSWCYEPDVNFRLI